MNRPTCEGEQLARLRETAFQLHLASGELAAAITIALAEPDPARRRALATELRATIEEWQAALVALARGARS